MEEVHGRATDTCRLGITEAFSRVKEMSLVIYNDNVVRL